MKLLYIAFKDFSNLHFGANAKVLAQCRALNNLGYDVELIGRIQGNIAKISIDGTANIIKTNKVKIKNKRIKNLYDKLLQIKTIGNYIKDKKYDATYIRYDFSDSSFIKLLKRIKSNSKKIFLELPTYPYEKENSNGILNAVKMKIDFKYRKKLKKYVDYIVTFYEGYDTLFGIKVLLVPNGFDFNSMNLVKTEINKNSPMHIIAVSSMREWHGYERFIEGLNIYYNINNMKENKNIILHLVGNGKEYDKYKDLINKYNLEKHVVLEGAMHGKELDDLYEICSLGIDSLARHRSGISVLSSLKSREYGAKGIPMINSCKIDVIENDFPYLLQVPANEEPIDIKEVIDFENRCYKNKTRLEVAKEIRDYIERKTSMESTLKSVVEEMK